MSPDQIVCICGTTHLDYDGPQVACPKHGIDVETVRWLHANGLCPVQTPAEAMEWVDRSNNPRTWRDTNGEGFLRDEPAAPLVGEDPTHTDLAVEAVRRARKHLERYVAGTVDVSDPTSDIVHEAMDAWMSTMLVPVDFTQGNMREVAEAIIGRVATVLVMVGWQPPARLLAEPAPDAEAGGVNTAIAAELERLAESIDVTAPLGDLIATVEAAGRREVARSLIARAAELRSAATEVPR